MWILVNEFLLMLAALLTVTGIRFYIRNIEASWRVNYYILVYCISSALWCITYGLIGMTDDFAIADILRMVGVGAIEAFLCNEVFFVTGMFKEKKRMLLFLRVAIIILALIDFIVFSQSGVNQYVRIGNWTTWTINPALKYARVVHSHFVGLAFVMALISGIVWAKTNRLMRQKRFIQLMFIANFILIIFAIPDTVLPALNMYAVPTSGIGAAGCALVMWYAATRLNSFDIRMGNITDKIYDFINTGVIVFDTDHRISIANPMARSLAYREIINCRIEDLFEMEDEAKQEIFISSLKNTYTVNCLGRDNKAYTLQMNAVLDDYGDPYCFICIFVDITHEVNLIQKLEIANNAKTQFLTSMSHEIRTPINAVVGFNEMINRKSDDPEIAEYSEYIDRAARHLLSIINNLLDMEQITVGKLALNPEDYDFSEVIRDVYSLNSLGAKTKGLEFKISSAPGVPRFLYGDSVRIQQIIINLTTNAIKYTKTGSVTLETDYKKKDGNIIDLIIRVRDTGIGIREEDKPHLFDTFERFDLDINRHVEGTGLGLALTKSLVEKMGGSISVESEYGRGSCFTVVIPQKLTGSDTRAVDMSDATRHANKYRASFTAPGAKVLVVDDNEFNLKVAEGLMKPLKINVECVESGREMLAVANSKKYDIIFLDHLMPEMDGITALKYLKEDRQGCNQDTPVIAMTANAIRGMKEVFLNEGFTDFLPKPVEPEVFEDIIRKHLKPELVEISQVELPDEEEPEGENDAFPTKAISAIEGIDLKRAFSNATGMDMLKELMLVFCNTAHEDAALLQEYYGKAVEGDKAELGRYRIKAHAMKNASATIGATSLSESAKALEFAAADENTEYISLNHEKFVDSYKDMASRLSNALSGEGQSGKGIISDEALLKELELGEQAMRSLDTNALNDFALRMQDAEFASEAIGDHIQKLMCAIRDFDEDTFFEVIEKVRNILT